MLAEDCWPASGFTRMSAALLWDVVSGGLVILGDRRVQREQGNMGKEDTE